MFKKLFAFAITLLLTFVLVPAVYAQPAETEFDKAYKQYRQTVEDYNKAHDAYILARSSYLKFKTLASKTDATMATLKMLEARDEVFISYLNSLAQKLKETSKVEEGRRTELTAKINEEVSWLSDHKNRLASAGSLEDLVSDSEEVKLRHKQTTESLFYEALAGISYGKITYFRERIGSLLSSIKGVFSTIKEEGKFTTDKFQLIDRWIFDSEARLSRAEGKQLEADKIISEALTKKASFVGRYDGIIIILKESHQYTKESSSFLKEVLREIKTAE